MDPRTAISYTLLLCFLVDVGVGLSSVDEANLRSSNPTLPTDVATESLSDEIVGSESTSSKRDRRDLTTTFERDDVEDDEDLDGAPPDHVVPHSPHEDPEEPPTKPKYRNPGDWAKPPPDRDIPLDFVPTKLYAQVRGTHTVTRAPQQEAIETAATAEEILSAPRLREVVSDSKKNTIYTEEGYEDSAYDHAGHIRDADFQEGFARKLKHKQKSKKESRNRPTDDETEEIRNEGSGGDEEFNEYDEDYRDHVEESMKVEEEEPPQRKKKKRKPLKYKSLKGIWQDPDIDPKHVTVNEITRLEKDLEKEYAESDKNVEDQIPENLMNTGDDDEDETYESESERFTTDSQEYGKRTDKNIAESPEASRQILKNHSGEVYKPEITEFPVVTSTKTADAGSTPTSANSAGFTIYENTQSTQSLPGDYSSTTPNYGQLFWNYFKLVGDKWKPKKVTTPTSDITSTTTGAEEFTSVPTFTTVHTSMRDFDTFSYSPPSTEMSDFVLASSSMGPVFPRPSSLYESWKRQGREINSDETTEFENLEAASSTYPMGFETTTKLQDVTTNVDRDETTTLVTPKKLSYTVIIRSNDKTTTTRPPCTREANDRPEETNSIVQLTSPKYTNMFKYLKDRTNPQEINDVAVQRQDFTVIQPPLPVPLRQVTYADFLPGTYTSPVRQSVTQESGQPGKKANGGRDRYTGPDSPYDKRYLNLFSHASDGPHFHHHHHQSGHHSPSGHKRSHPRRNSPPTKLVPPSPMLRSKYAEYLGVERLAKPKTRFDRSPRLEAWPELLELYRSIDRTFFAPRRRRSLERERKIEESRAIADKQTQRTPKSNRRGKVNRESFDASPEKKLRPERNLFNERANRLVALDAAETVKLPSGNNVRREKFNEVRRIRDHEDLLNKSPRIAEETINAEIESRFKPEEDGEDEEGEYEDDDSAEKERGKVAVEVPDFNVSEVIEDTKGEKVITDHSTGANKLNVDKYPFYRNSRVPKTSVLKYITNPRQVPRKTLGGTEFYDSRDRYLECDEVEPNLEDVVPEEEEPVPNREPRGDEPRLRGLGDKLDCFRAKYFDENPLDNPLFLEKQIDQPRVPEEFDPAKFALRIFGIPSQQKRQAVPRVSRKPELVDLRKSGSNRSQVSQEEEKKARLTNDKNSRRGEEQSTKNHRSRQKRPDRQRKKSEQATTQPPPDYQVTPYQRQVYEDVMGTIKNLAGMYQAFGEPVRTPSVQLDVNPLPDDPRDGDWRFQEIRITERPRSFLIHGLLPPQETPAFEPQLLKNYRVIPYRANRVAYRTRLRAENPPRNEGLKVGYLKTVRVHKRSIDDWAASESRDMDTEESRNIVRGIKNSTSTVSVKKMSFEGREREEKPAASERVVYTIRDRIRYSKPRENFGKNGKFSNLDAAGTEDVRRQEPRYNRIRHRKVPPTSNNDSSNLTSGERIEIIQSADGTLKPVTAQNKTLGRQDFHDEPGEVYKIQFSTTRGTQTSPNENRRRDKGASAESEENYEEEEEKESQESREEKPQKNNYDVHENVQEDVTTVANLNVEPTKSPEFYKLQKYLQSDPPGYSETFTESSAEPDAEVKGKKSKRKNKEEEEEEKEPNNQSEEQPTKPYQKSETRRDNEQVKEAKEDEEQEEDEQVEKPESYTDEESSPKSEEAEDAPAESESYKNAEDEDEETKDDESSHDGEKEFHRFTSRPYSPFESFEDPKYSELGPRINKPAFHHPTFSKLTSSKPRKPEYYAHSDDAGSDDEGTEKMSRYIFPWELDEAEGAEGADESRKTGRYEYPWEKRERLAKERRRREKAQREYEKLFGYPYDSDDESEEKEEQTGSNTEILGRRVYPWEHYEMPSMHWRGKLSRKGQVFDNVEVGSEHRPITKFSSRYKSRTFNINDDGDPISGSGADPGEIRVSVMESVKKASDSVSVDPVEVLKNIIKTNASTMANSTTTNSYRVPGASSTTAPKRARNWKTFATSTSSTVIPATTTTRSTRLGARPNSRSWRIASTTTKKPIRSRKRVVSPIGNELLRSESQRKEVATAGPIRENNSNSSTIISLTTTAASVGNRKNRRRGQHVNRTINLTTTTARPVRRRLPKTTVAPKVIEETAVKSVTERTTTPKSKTIEHRSSFSKEEIITKTSYPRLDTDEDKDEHDEASKDSFSNDRRGKDSKKSNKLMNETVKKVSIVTKKTPDHIYRTEEVDKDGVKGMFVSITPNNGTGSSMDSMEGPDDRRMDNEDTKEMLKRFDDFDDKEIEQDAGSSFMQDSHLMANLLRQVPPFMNDLTFDESFQGGGSNFLETEGSGDGEIDEDARDDAKHKSKSTYEKHPNNRLYYYVEK